MALSILRCDFRALSSVFGRNACRFATVRPFFSSHASKIGSRQGEGVGWGAIADDDANFHQRRVRTDENWKRASRDFMAMHSARNTTVGRSVEVKDGKIAAAAQNLHKLISLNGIGREWFSNKRRIQRGEYLRDLRRKRWRIRFAAEVGRKVQLVKEIRRRESHAY